MAIPATTDWAKMRYVTLLIFVTGTLLATATGRNTSGKQKRQLFREHLLPLQGGKIPESAFVPARLVLNRLNQQGFFSPDGLLLDQRHQNQPYPKQLNPGTIKVPLRSDNRYVVPYGRIYAQRPSTIDTTYLIREPVQNAILPKVVHLALPLAPHSSLKLLHHYRQKRLPDNSWNDIFPPNGFSSQILAEFAPYLEKLHQFDFERV